MEKLRVAIIGCGAIGQTVLHYFDTPDRQVDICAVLDIDVNKARAVVHALRYVKPVVVSTLEELLSSRPDVVVEAASPEAVKQYLPHIIGKVRHVILMSVSAFVDVDFLKSMLEKCRISGTRLHIPSGAIGGVDLVKTHALHGLRRITLTTRKTPQALGVQVREPTVVYEGDVVEAIRRFPRNVNIYLTVLLSSGMQTEKIRCRVVADPSVTRNVHELEIESDLGYAYVRVENVPTEINPRTSKLAAYSVVRKLLELAQPHLDIGT